MNCNNDIFSDPDAAKQISEDICIEDSTSLSVENALKDRLIQSSYQALIEYDEVDALLGPFSSTFTFGASDVAHAAGMVQ